MSSYARFKKDFISISMLLRRKGVPKGVRCMIAGMLKHCFFDEESRKLKMERFMMIKQANDLPEIRHRYNRQMCWIKQLVVTLSFPA
jgi:hypothetical protein